MPIASAAFLIVFANLAVAADLTQPHGGRGPHAATLPSAPEAPTQDSPRDPGDWLRTCAPDVDLCDQVAEACVADGMEEQECDAFAENLCPGNQYMACKAIANVCEDETGGACEHIDETCKENLDACPAPACAMAGTLDPAEAVAFCFANPLTLGCEEPSAGMCLELMTWKECGVSTCEWAQCAADLEAMNWTCKNLHPASCMKIAKCMSHEDMPPHAASTETSEPLPIRGPLDCCEWHGVAEGKTNTCDYGEPGFCIGCDYKPVLCMTHGCSTPDEEDCCLSPDGETVPC
mgnify:FL=1